LGFRIQEERFESEKAYRKACENYIINDKTMHRAKPGMRVLHPLPRKFEISTEFDSDERAAYFRQVSISSIGFGRKVFRSFFTLKNGFDLFIAIIGTWRPRCILAVKSFN
jgi:hypothetical protein